jgi:signal-transduction protein with cAMP-binding, CBS, and nucleotidyltransferase domain
VSRHATADRLAGLIEKDAGSREDLAALDADHKLVLRLILAQQLDDIAAGRPPSNRVSMRRVEKVDREALKDALSRQTIIAELLRGSLEQGSIDLDHTSL